ncbi:hypothetical protein [Paraburkholderia humisilvae]|nr:hypothetical protein [Paraburkholderia humisilvae]
MTKEFNRIGAGLRAVEPASFELPHDEPCDFGFRMQPHTFQYQNSIFAALPDTPLTADEIDAVLDVPTNSSSRSIGPSMQRPMAQVGPVRLTGPLKRTVDLAYARMKREKGAGRPILNVDAAVLYSYAVSHKNEGIAKNGTPSKNPFGDPNKLTVRGAARYLNVNDHSLCKYVRADGNYTKKANTIRRNVYGILNPFSDH